MTLGSCLVANEIPGSAEAFIQARVDGKSWQQIATEFDLPNPSAARKAFEKATGISDFKIKGHELANLVKQGPDALKAVNQAKVAAKKVKALDDVIAPKPDMVPDLQKKVDWPEPSAPNIKQELHQAFGLTDDDFDEMHGWWKKGKGSDFFSDEFGINESDFEKLVKLWKGDLPTVDIGAMDLDTLKKLGNDLMKKKNDDLFALQMEKSQAKTKYLDYLDEYEGTPQYSQSKVDSLQSIHKSKIKAVNDYSTDILPKLEADIKKVQDAIAAKPAAVPNILVNQPVKNKFVNDVNLQQKTGLTQDQIDKILELNKDGKFYTEIKSGVPGVDFAQIDDVVWNDLLKKHDGFTWNAYVEKPTSESGFNAVKDKVYESRAKGLTVDEIAAKPGAPPKPVIQAIIDDKWKLPSPGTKVPNIPPPPPPPPQVFGGSFPSSGTAFRRHSDTEMLDWIRADTGTLTSAQRKAVSNYTNSGYHDINTYLRGGGLTDTSGYGYSGSNVSKLVQDIDATMRPIPVDVTLTRNFNGIHHLPAAPEEMVGKVMWDDAFLSTSVKEAGVFSGDVQLIINAPAGTMGRYVNDISVHTNEQEMLLARGLRMVVTKVEKHSTGHSARWRLFVDVISV